ncbi:MAG: hypothetical protein DWQ10_03825 [Calditrichaeota bacterium]|nr:MAG: hypothetical protein DWQ10_03825 [Calditrichota bacterium]
MWCEPSVTLFLRNFIFQDMVDKKSQKNVEFPKEYRKKFIRSRDWKFILLALASIVIHALSIRFLFTHYPSHPDANLSQHAMRRFAQRYINELVNENKSSSTDSDLIPVSASSYDAHPVKLVQPTLPTVLKKGHSSEDESASARPSTENSIRKSVNKTGLLGIIHATTAGTNAEVQDFFMALDSSALALNAKLKQFNDFIIPEAGIEYLNQEFVQSLEPEVDSPDTHSISSENASHLYSREIPEQTINHIKKIILSNNAPILRRYKEILFLQPGLKGRLSIRFALNQTGEVVYATILNSTINAPAFENQVLTLIRQWKNFGNLPIIKDRLYLRHTYVFSLHGS